MKVQQLKSSWNISLSKVGEADDLKKFLNAYILKRDYVITEHLEYLLKGDNSKIRQYDVSGYIIFLNTDAELLFKLKFG